MSIKIALFFVISDAENLKNDNKSTLARNAKSNDERGGKKKRQKENKSEQEEKSRQKKIRKRGGGEGRMRLRRKRILVNEPTNSMYTDREKESSRT